MSLSQEKRTQEKHDLSLLGSSPSTATIQTEEARPPPPYSPYLERSGSSEQNDSDSENGIKPPTTKGGFQIRSVLIFLTLFSLLMNVSGFIAIQMFLPPRTPQERLLPVLNFLILISTLLTLFVTRNGNHLLVIFISKCLVLVASLIVGGLGSVKSLEKLKARPSLDNESQENIVFGFLSILLVSLVVGAILAAIELKFIWIYAHYLLKVAGKESIFSSWRWPFSQKKH